LQIINKNNLDQIITTLYSL